MENCARAEAPNRKNAIKSQRKESRDSMPSLRSFMFAIWFFISFLLRDVSSIRIA
jgi:hypothetical protein